MPRTQPCSIKCQQRPGFICVSGAHAHAHVQEVLRFSRALAVRTLQLEMEYAGRALEDEAIDIVGSDVDGRHFTSLHTQ